MGTGNTSPGTTPSGSPTPSTTTGKPSCAEVMAARMSRNQRVGQLLMLGLSSASGPASLDRRITSLHAGGVVFLGGWSGASQVKAASSHLQRLATQRATAKVKLLVAADQEGGQVQQLTGPGFTDIPSALRQGALPPDVLRERAAAWGRELARAGVNVDLAPVADTVPSDLGRANGPIGRYDREFSHDPERVADAAVAVVRGMRRAGVQTTVKHFPGLGRIRANTDTSATGITDTVTTMSDSFLGPFAEAIDAGTGLVMVSSARYPRMDSERQAVFSSTVVTTLLRDRFNYDGVVVSDDLGRAKAVAAVPTGSRAVRFLSAGGDIILTADAARASTMVSAITERMAEDPAFARRVEQSVRRVLTLKARMGLVSCGG